MVSSFTFKLCAAVLILTYLHGSSVHAIFNDHLETLMNIFHGEGSDGLRAFFSRGRNRNTGKNHDHDDDDYDNHDHGTKNRGATRTRGRNKDTQRRIKIRGKVNCTCSIPKETFDNSELNPENSELSHGNSELNHGNSAALNGLNGVQNAEVLQAIIRALLNSGSHKEIDNRYNHLGLLCFPNVTLASNNV